MDEKRNTGETRYFYISLLNVLACFSVVMVHNNDVFWDGPQSPVWISANLIETLFYFGVPVFFMITGVTLIDYKERYSTKTFFKKRFRKRQ